MLLLSRSLIGGEKRRVLTLPHPAEYSVRSRLVIRFIPCIALAFDGHRLVLDKASKLLHSLEKANYVIVIIVVKC